MRVLLGLIESLYLPAALALVAEYHDFATRAKAQSMLSVGQYLGMVAGGTLAGYLGEQHGWRSPMYVLGGTGLALAVVCWLFLPRGAVQADPESPQERSREVSFLQGLGSLLRIPSFGVLAGGGVLTAIGAWIFINWLPLYFRENFGSSLAEAGFLGSSLVSVSAAVSQLFGGAISDKVAKKGVHRRLWMNAILILAAAPTLLTFVVTANRTAVMVALVLYSAFRNAGDLNLIPLLCDVAGKERMSIAIGVTNMLNTFVGGAGILAAGFLKSGFGLTSVFTGIALVLLVDAGLLFTGCILFIRRDLNRTLTETSLAGQLRS
jgi:predicted MFS family arabinose efflux permease